MNRRQFLLTTAAGFILPSFFDKAFTFIEQFEEPLIIKPKDVTTELFVYADGFNWQFNLGSPHEQPPEMTYREFIKRYWCDDIACWLDDWDKEPDTNLDEVMNFWEMIDSWCRTDSPNAKAYRLLEKFDLGPNFNSPDALGELQFIDGPCPGNDYLGIHAEDYISISLLQERLNQLNSGIHVRVWEGS